MKFMDLLRINPRHKQIQKEYIKRATIPSMIQGQIVSTYLSQLVFCLKTLEIIKGYLKHNHHPELNLIPIFTFFTIYLWILRVVVTRTKDVQEGIYGRYEFKLACSLGYALCIFVIYFSQAMVIPKFEDFYMLTCRGNYLFMLTECFIMKHFPLSIITHGVHQVGLFWIGYHRFGDQMIEGDHIPVVFQNYLASVVCMAIFQTENFKIFTHFKELKTKDRFQSRLMGMLPGQGILFYNLKNGVVYSNDLLKDIGMKINLEVGEVLDQFKHKIDGGVSLLQTLRDLEEFNECQVDEEVGELLVPLDQYTNDYCLHDGKGDKREFEVQFIQTHYYEQRSILVFVRETSHRLKLKEAQYGEVLKTSILCSFSHELRTPLNQIQGMHEFLAKSLPQKLKTYLKIAQSSSQLLLNKVDDILDYCQIELKEFKVNYHSFCVRQQLSNLKELFLSQIEQKEIFKLQIVVDDNVPPLIKHDEKRLTQILTDITQNAIKYTSRGKVEVYSGLTDEGMLEFRVSDTGCGIEDSRLKQMFSLFNSTQAQDKDQTALGGILGMNIIQQICHELGSEIHIKSSVGVGTDVWFQIPLDEHSVDEGMITNESELAEIKMVRYLNYQTFLGKQNGILESSSESEEQVSEVLLPGFLTCPHECARVLIVDDSYINRMVLSEYCQRVGIKYYTAENGQEAVEVGLRERRCGIQLVFMDLNMPIMDGIQATKKLLNQKPELRVVAVTSFVSETQRRNCDEVGMVGFLSKPLAFNQFKQYIQNIK